MYVFRQAQKKPQTLFIGVDSNADNLCDRSQKAARAPKKGGLPNLIYVHAGIETLPEELYGIASTLTILLPWGSLLKAAAGQDLALLKNISKLCRPKANIRVILGYQPSADPKVIEGLGLPLLTPDYLNTALSKAYRQAGFLVEWHYLAKDTLKTLETTWAKKLAYGRERQFVEITGLKILEYQ